MFASGEKRARRLCFIHVDLEGNIFHVVDRRHAEPAQCAGVTGNYVKGESKVEKSKFKTNRSK